MGGKIAGDRNQDVPTRVVVAPCGELPDSRLQHLICKEARILTQQGMCERDDQRLG